MKNNKVIINALVGLVSQTIIIAISFIVPRIYLTSYGSDTNGLVNTIAQIFGYVALLEAGISQAAKNALYPRIAKGDHNGVSEIASISKEYFRRVSYIYGVVVIILAVILPYILKTNVNFWTIFFIVVFEGLGGIITFYFTATWSCIITTYGNTYVINIINLSVKILSSSAKIVLALLHYNIAYVQLAFFLVTCFQALFYYFYMKKKYPWIQYNVKPEKVLLLDRNYYVITEVAWTIFSSTDMIVLSIMVSTASASVYSIYNLIFISLNLVINAIFHSVSYLLGQSFQKSIEDYSIVHDNFNSIMMSLCTTFMCVSLLLTVPFVKLYTSGIEDINYTYKYLPLLFCSVQMLSWSRQVAGNLTGLAGFAKPTSIVSIIEASINVGLSFLLVYYWGIYGVILATVFALPIKVIYVNYISEKKVLNRHPLKTLLIFGTNYIVFGFTAFFSLTTISIDIHSYFEFILYGFGLLFVFSIIVFAVNITINRKMIILFKRLLRK